MHEPVTASALLSAIVARPESVFGTLSEPSLLLSAIAHLRRALSQRESKKRRSRKRKRQNPLISHSEFDQRLADGDQNPPAEPGSNDRTFEALPRQAARLLSTLAAKVTEIDQKVSEGLQSWMGDGLPVSGSDPVQDDIDKCTKPSLGSRIRHVFACIRAEAGYTAWCSATKGTDLTVYVRNHYPYAVQSYSRGILYGQKFKLINAQKEGLAILAAFAIDPYHKIPNEAISSLGPILEGWENLRATIETAASQYEACEVEYSRLTKQRQSNRNTEALSERSQPEECFSTINQDGSQFSEPRFSATTPATSCTGADMSEPRSSILQTLETSQAVYAEHSAGELNRDSASSRNNEPPMSLVHSSREIASRGTLSNGDDSSISLCNLPGRHIAEPRSQATDPFDVGADAGYLPLHPRQQAMSTNFGAISYRDIGWDAAYPATHGLQPGSPMDLNSLVDPHDVGADAWFCSDDHRSLFAQSSGIGFQPTLLGRGNFALPLYSSIPTGDHQLAATGGVAHMKELL